MCAKVTEVEDALEDVRELLSRKDPDDRGWQYEWVRIVQDVVEKDAGWKYVGCVIPPLLTLLIDVSFHCIDQLDDVLEDDPSCPRHDSSGAQCHIG